MLITNASHAIAGPAATDVDLAATEAPREDFADLSTAASGFATTPRAIKTSTHADGAGFEDRAFAGSQQQPESAFASDAATSAPDSAHSKRSIAGLGLDQPGSASKRLRPAESDSPLSKLPQSLDGLSTGETGVSEHSHFCFASCS